jgi:hypothetical protein
VYITRVRRRIINRRCWPALLVAALIIGVGQLGRLRVPDTYRSEQEKRCAEAIALTGARPVAPDVLVMGNSATEYGVNAAKLSAALRMPGKAGSKPTVVNLAVPGGNPQISLWLWRRLARSHAVSRTSVLVVGVAPIDLINESPGHDYSLRYLFRARDAVWLLSLGQINDAAALLTFRAFPLYARGTAIRDLIARRQPPPLHVAGENQRLWWVGIYYRWYRQYRAQRYQVLCLQQLIAEAQRRRVQVVLVSLPVHRWLQDVTAGATPPGMGLVERSRRGAQPGLEVGETPLARFNVAVRDCVRRYRVPYFDYLTTDQSARFAYEDPPHLTKAAALRFTAELGQRISDYLNRPGAHRARTDSEG